MIVALSILTNSSLLQAITYRQHLRHTTRPKFFQSFDLFLILMCATTTRITELSFVSTPVSDLLYPSFHQTRLPSKAAAFPMLIYKCRLIMVVTATPRRTVSQLQTALQYVIIVPIKYKILFLIFVVPRIMLYSSEICPTRCNNCVFILRNGFTLHVSGDNLTHHQEYICSIWPHVSRLTQVVSFVQMCQQ